MTLQTILDLSFTSNQGSTSIIDSSPSNHVITCVGGVAVDVISSNDARLKLVSGGFCYTPDAPDFSLAQKDFEINVRVRYPSIPNNSAIIAQFNGSDGNDCFELTHKQGAGIRLLMKRGGSVIFDMAENGQAFAANTDYDILITRTGNNLNIKRNGIIVLSGNLSGDAPDPTSPIYLGYSFYSYNQSIYSNGWLDNITFKKDDAVPPPPSPPPSPWRTGVSVVSRYAPLGIGPNRDKGATFLFVNTTIPSTYANLPPTTYPAPGIYIPQTWIELDIGILCGIPIEEDIIAVKIGGIIGLTMGNTNEIGDLHIHLRNPIYDNNGYIFQSDATLASGGDRDMGETVVAVENRKIKFAWWCSAFPPDYPNRAAFFFNLNLHEYIRAI